MMPASNRGVGMNMGFPDVCLTPAAPSPIPIPYPNIALNAQATPFSPNVKITQMNALNMASTVPMTSGDEGGVAHATFKGSGRWTMGNPIVKINMMPAINLLCPSTGNNMNDPLGAQTVPSITNVFLTFDSGGAKDQPVKESPRNAIDGAISSRTIENLAAQLAAAELSIERSVPGVLLLRPQLLTMKTCQQIENAVESADDLRLLILDLRGNGGGDLRAAARLADGFLEPGLEIYRLLSHDGDEQPHFTRHRGSWKLPTLILVDRQTASAAEVLALALQHHRRAKVLGQTTLGKATLQQLLPASDGLGARYGTTHRIEGPGGRAFDQFGIVPDLALPAEDGSSGGAQELVRHTEDDCALF